MLNKYVDCVAADPDACQSAFDLIMVSCQMDRAYQEGMPAPVRMVKQAVFCDAILFR